MNIWKEYYPEIKLSQDLAKQICKELYANGFLYNEAQLLGNGKMTSQLGDEF
ncbi:hypothetical protein [Arcobacter sp.]|uniref:hypothetical protein n=1 Tax=Arcobacter sp. TaxID=1872629 RepID=UPI003C72C1C2